MRFSALLFSFFAILLGLTQVAALQPVIVRDSESDQRDDHGEEIGRSGWFSSALYRSTFLPPLAGAAIQQGTIPKIEETLKAAVNGIFTTGAIIKTLQNIDIKEFQDRLAYELSRVSKELQNEFSEPLPEDKTERYKRQETMITQAVEKIEDAVVHVCRNWKISEDIVREDFNKVKPHLNHALLIVANLVNNHPDLAWFLCSSVIIVIIPERFILRPIVRFFGFGRLGPVKGSIAARAQRFFYGASVPKSSLFAWLQSAGMKRGGRHLEVLQLLLAF